MPVYNVACSTPLSTSDREKAALSITDLHCRYMGVPAYTVSVVFLDGYPLTVPHKVSVLAGISTLHLKRGATLHDLEARIQQSIAEALVEPLRHVSVKLVNFPNACILEQGKVDTSQPR